MGCAAAAEANAAKGGGFTTPNSKKGRQKKTGSKKTGTQEHKANEDVDVISSPELSPVGSRRGRERTPRRQNGEDDLL